MDRDDFRDLEWLEPWYPMLDGTPCEQELRKEVASAHPLYGVAAHAIARRLDTDDVLFLVPGAAPPLAVVHLTWRGEPEPDPRWPWTRFIPSRAAWIEDGMRPDHEEFRRGGPA